MTLPQLLLVTFISMWVIGDITGASYNYNLGWSITMTILIAYINNLHGILYTKLRRYTTQTP